MERILALQAMKMELSNMNDPVLGSTESVKCSSDTNNGCSSQSNNCQGTQLLDW